MGEVDDLTWPTSREPATSGESVPRYYGVDVSVTGEALVEATVLDDGTLQLALVWMPAAAGA